MMPLSSRSTSRRSQVLVIFALALVVLLALVGFGIDGGLAYVRRARLNKAVDAAAIVTTRHIGKPEAVMRQYAYDAVRANDPNATLNPTNDISIRFTYDDRGVPIKVNVGVDARGVQPMTFMRVLGFDQVPVSAAAEAVRFPIAMAVIIDRSGSMTGNGGSTTIPATIPGFLENFIPGFDTVGIYSYSWTPVRELAFTTNFLGQAMRDLFNGSSKRIQFSGYTSPADCLRMALQDMEQLRAYNERGVKKIVVFMTDGLFNTFRTRPPNVMGAFSAPPPGKSQSWWDENYLNTDPLYGSISQWGSDGSGIPPLRSLSGPSYRFPAEGGGFTFFATNRYGEGVIFRNLDAVVNEANDFRFPGIGITQRFSFAQPSGGAYTNAYLVAGKGSSASGYPEGVSINDSSNSRIKLINPRFRYQNVDLPNDSKNAIARFESDFRFLSSADGSWKRLRSSDIQAEAREHALRYCDVARKDKTDPRRITIFTIGFGNDSQLDVDVLMKMANLNPSDRDAPYTPRNSNEPFDDTFGFTLARNSDELHRTYVALGIYLATRLTK